MSIARRTRNLRTYGAPLEPLVRAIPDSEVIMSDKLAMNLKHSGYADSVLPVSLAGHDHFSILEPLAQPQSEIGRQILAPA
jgi:hypothetical protein